MHLNLLSSVSSSVECAPPYLSRRTVVRVNDKAGKAKHLYYRGCPIDDGAIWGQRQKVEKDLLSCG